MPYLSLALGELFALLFLACSLEWTALGDVLAEGTLTLIFTLPG